MYYAWVYIVNVEALIDLGYVILFNRDNSLYTVINYN